ncbi:hypothetical protein ACFWHW_24575 [Streptomyces pharetrae]|uniref:hypothetical protein n=1 Tax=Streptomyces pharetrae TaxID=291370 RepID=UPI00365A7D6F
MSTGVPAARPIGTLAGEVRTSRGLGRHQAVTAGPFLIVTCPVGAGNAITALLQVGRGACRLART